MALNKRKVLEAARKHAQKGAKAKALKEYDKLLKAEPRDAKLLLEVGDAYRRWGQTEDAIAQYSKVAAQYRQDGFDARAVAVFKQMLNLDPKQYAAYVSLSELYQRMGLDSEAAAALQMAADGYHKEGRKTEALDLLRQMGALDPSNTTSRTKIAELLQQEGMEEDALAEYVAIAGELSQQNDRDQLIVIQERILELCPTHVQTLTGLARTLMSSGDLKRAETYAARAAKADPETPQYELLIDLYAQMGNDEGLGDATRSLAKIYRDRGDEDKARELMQRLSVDEMASSSARLAVDLSEAEEPDLGDDDLLDDEPFLSLGDDDSFSSESERPSLDFGEVSLDEEAPLEAKPAKNEGSDASIPEGDTDQLLAEASVYLRYGKTEQALSSLHAILSIEPDHRAAHEKLGECHAECGANSDAVQSWLRAATLSLGAGDDAAVTRLRERIASIDPDVASSVEQASPGGEPDDSVPSISGIGADITETTGLAGAHDIDLDLEFDDVTDELGDEISESETETNGATAPVQSAGAADAAFEIDLDEDSITFDEPPQTDREVVETAPPSGIEEELDLDSQDLESDQGDEIDFEIDVDMEDDLEADDALNAVAEEGAGEGDSASASMSDEKIGEELEEAEFYIAQDMFNEAEVIVTRVLAAAPNHAAALVMSGEIAAGRGVAAEESSAAVEADSVTEAASEEAAPASSDQDEQVVFEPEEEVTFEVEVDSPEDDGAELDLSGEETFEVEPEPELEAEAAEAAASEDVEAAPVEAEAAEVAPPSEEACDAAEAPSDTNEDSFDLREALADVLDDDAAPDVSSDAGVLSTVEDGFGSIFSDFKKGVTATLESSDFDTRYDLGIAYREMGLFEDAIGEFRICLDSPDRQFDSLYLMGLCARDLQRWEDGINHLEQALALPEIPEERLAQVFFDLSVIHEGAGDLERATSTMQRVIELESEFPGAADRLAALESGTSVMPELGTPGETYESFDDLFESDDADEEGDVAVAEAVPEATYESFDDVVDLSDEMGDGVEAVLPEPVEEPSTKKTGRRKISFI